MEIHDTNTFNHMYYTAATCSGFGELLEQMLDANLSDAPLPTPIPISTSFGSCLKNPKVDPGTVSNRFYRSICALRY